jgi:hypothetical protein
MRLRVDYDPEFTTLTVYPFDEDSSWGVMDFDGVPALPYERDRMLIDAIEDHPHYEKLVARSPADQEKLAMVLTEMDGKTWYAASTRKVKILRPSLFGKNGRIWLTTYPELAMVRTMKEAGRRRVGFNRAGDVIRGTLQVEFPSKIPWGRQVYLYEIKPEKMDVSRTFRVGQFQYETMASELTPERVYTSSLMTMKRLFTVTPLYAEEK